MAISKLSDPSVLLQSLWYSLRHPPLSYVAIGLTAIGIIAAYSRYYATPAGYPVNQAIPTRYSETPPAPPPPSFYANANQAAPTWRMVEATEGRMENPPGVSGQFRCMYTGPGALPPGPDGFNSWCTKGTSAAAAPIYGAYGGNNVCPFGYRLDWPSRTRCVPLETSSVANTIPPRDPRCWTPNGVYIPQLGRCVHRGS